MLTKLSGQGIYDPVDRLDGAGSMKGSEDEMSRFGCRHRHRDCLGIAHFTHENHIGILSHGRPDTIREACHMCSYFPLYHLRVSARMHELDWIFKANNIEVTGLVEVVNHGRERRRLAGAGGTGYQDEALMIAT